MKKLLLALVLLACGPAAAQWQVPVNTIPVGRGPGVSGFGSISNTGTGTLCLLNTAPPTFGTCAVTVPGGSNTQLQYNNAGAFGGVTGATFGGGVLTLPAYTLSGTLSGGGNQINNVIIGNVSPQPASFTALSAFTSANVGPSNPSLPTGTIFSISNNTGFTIPAMSGFVPQAVIVGADNTRGELAIQSYAATGGESTILLFGARGTMAAPTATKSGDFVGELGFHPHDGTNFVHNAGAVIIGALTEDTTPTNAGQELRVYTTPITTATAKLNTTFNDSGGQTIWGATSGGIKFTVPAVAGSNTVTFPAGTTNFSATGGTSQVVKQTSAGGAFTVAQLALADISGKGTGVDTALGVNVGTAGAFSTAPLTVANNVLGANVLLNNTANYFDGPSMAQGTSGTWFVIGKVSATDTVGGAFILCKLWDGTTVIDSAAGSAAGANFAVAMTMAGTITNPAANIKISCKDLSSTNGIMLFNQSGNSKDSSIVGTRIAN